MYINIIKVVVLLDPSVLKLFEKQYFPATIYKYLFCFLSTHAEKAMVLANIQGC